MADEYSEQPQSSGGGGGSNMQALITPRPSLDFVKAWPRIVELVIRGICIGLTFCLFISTCAAIDSLRPFLGFRITNGANSTAGWLLFVSLLTMIVQGLIIAAKFLNFGFMSTYELIVFIVDVAIAGLTAGALFCGAIPAAVYADDLRGGINGTGPSTGAVAAFAFLALFAFIGLIVWLVISRFLLTKMLNYAGRSGGSSGDPSAPPAQEY